MRTKLLISFCFLIPSVSLAQQTATPEQLTALAQAYRSQLIAASDQIAELSAQLALAQREIANLRKVNAASPTEDQSHKK